jgi:hypothetical protein
MKVNFLIEHMGSSQLAYLLIKACNHLAAAGKYSPIIFYNQISRKVIQPHFPTMQLVEAWAQSGMTISTSLDLTINLLDFPGPNKKIFYVWDLEWIRDIRYRWKVLSDIFLDKKIIIIAQNEIHANAIYNSFHRKPDYLIYNCDIKQFEEMLNNE